MAERRALAASAGMAELPGGEFLMGSEAADAEEAEGPVRPVTVAPFAIDCTAVTNAQFAAFAAATGYRTEAEAIGWAYVFVGLLSGAQIGRAHRLNSSH